MMKRMTISILILNFDADDYGNDDDDDLNSHFDATDDDDKPTWAAR